MIQHYDQQLILEAQEYFSKLYGREIAPDEADSFLTSLVNLYNSLFNRE
jgi:hypothetical protein